MPVISLFNQTALTKSTDQNTANLINLYLVEDQNQGKYDQGNNPTPFVAYPTPGCTLFSAGSSVQRALWTEHGVTYGIDGNQFFSVNSSGTRTNIGTLNTSSGWAKIRGIKDQLLIVDSANGYYYKITANTFGQITDSNFPTAIQDIECQDEFGLVLNQNSQTWQAAAISDLTTWPALSFASTTGNQNYNIAIASCHRELYIFGDQTTEVWDNLGTVNFTFGRNTSVFVEWGCSARSSVAKGDNTLYFLAKSPTGGNVVAKFQEGYTPQIISTRAINYQISTYTTVSDAFAFIYQQEGHEFYVITFPTAQVTWVYDITTNLWHQRQSLISSVQTNWLANCYTFNYNKCLIGDSNTGNIYQLDMSNYTENSNAITRTFVSHPFYTGGWITISKLQVDFDSNPASSLSNWNLYISRDGGKTFGSAKAASPQQDSNGMWRCYWLRLGIAHAFVLKISTNANIKTIILGAWANMSSGDIK